MMETMIFADEVVPHGRPRRTCRRPRSCKASDRELKMAQQLIESLSTRVRARALQGRVPREGARADRAQGRGRGDRRRSPRRRSPARCPDLMAALEASLAAVKDDGDEAQDEGASSSKSSSGGGAKTKKATASKSSASAVDSNQIEPGRSVDASGGSSSTDSPAERARRAARTSSRPCRVVDLDAQDASAEQRPTRSPLESRKSSRAGRARRRRRPAPRASARQLAAPASRTSPSRSSSPRSSDESRARRRPRSSNMQNLDTRASLNRAASGELARWRRLRRAGLLGPGHHPPAGRQRLRASTTTSTDDARIEEPEVLERIRELGHPARLEGRLDLPVPQRAPAGDGRRRRRPQAVPLPRRPGARRRDAEKFDDMIALRPRAAAAARAGRAPTSPAPTSSTRERVLACAVRLLDRGFFRIGTEEYTVQRVLRAGDDAQAPRHASRTATRWSSTTRPRAASAASRRSWTRWRSDIVRALKRRRGGGAGAARLQAGPPLVRRAQSDDINAYLKEATGDDFSAKDFRTWSATVLAAIALAVSGPADGTQDLAPAGDHARGQGDLALPRQHARRCAARPTSTRASSTPTGAGCHRPRRIEEALDAEPGELPTHHPRDRGARCST